MKHFRRPATREADLEARREYVLTEIGDQRFLFIDEGE
jgi:hypothetical protein